MEPRVVRFEGFEGIHLVADVWGDSGWPVLLLHGGGQTIVLVTHDDDVAAVADRIVRMKDGRIDDGAPSAPGRSGGVFGVLEDDEAP